MKLSWSNPIFNWSTFMTQLSNFSWAKTLCGSNWESSPTYSLSANKSCSSLWWILCVVIGHLTSLAFICHFSADVWIHPQHLVVWEDPQCWPGSISLDVKSKSRTGLRRFWDLSTVVVFSLLSSGSTLPTAGVFHVADEDLRYLRLV